MNIPGLFAFFILFTCRHEFKIHSDVRMSKLGQLTSKGCVHRKEYCQQITKTSKIGRKYEDVRKSAYFDPLACHRSSQTCCEEHL